MLALSEPDLTERAKMDSPGRDGSTGDGLDRARPRPQAGDHPIWRRRPSLPEVVGETAVVISGRVPFLEGAHRDRRQGLIIIRGLGEP
jgi:hypothetical protein